MYILYLIYFILYIYRFITPATNIYFWEFSSSTILMKSLRSGCRPEAWSNSNLDVEWACCGRLALLSKDSLVV